MRAYNRAYAASHAPAEGQTQETSMTSPLKRLLTLLAATLLLAGCGSGPGGPPHPGAANPYSSGGFSDAGPNYPDTGR